MISAKFLTPKVSSDSSGVSSKYRFPALFGGHLEFLHKNGFILETVRDRVILCKNGFILETVRDRVILRKNGFILETVRDRMILVKFLIPSRIIRHLFPNILLSPFSAAILNFCVILKNAFISEIV